MKAVGRGLGPAMAFLALIVAAPAGAQENLDQGKTGAQLYAADCALCHKNPQTLNKSGGLFGLSSFLREHYTASKESAASIAAYLQSVGNAPAPAKRTTKRTAKGEDKAKLDEEKKGKAKSGEAKGEDKAKVDEKKPGEDKAKADADKKAKAKSDEKKAGKSEKTRKDESKTEQKSEKKTEKKSPGTNSGEPKAKESKTKDAKVMDAKDKDKDAKASSPKEAKTKKKSDSAAAAKPDKKEKSDDSKSD